MDRGRKPPIRDEAPPLGGACVAAEGVAAPPGGMGVEFGRRLPRWRKASGLTPATAPGRASPGSPGPASP